MAAHRYSHGSAKLGKARRKAQTRKMNNASANIFAGLLGGLFWLLK